MDTDDNATMVRKPLYLITSSQECWRCRTSQPVVALASSSIQGGDDEDREALGSSDPSQPSIFCEITEMPESLLELIQTFHPPYRKHSFKSGGRAYFANFCTCGANFGDHFLFMEPGGAFFPMSEEEASSMTIRTLPITASVEIRGNICYGAEDLIFDHGKRV